MEIEQLSEGVFFSKQELISQDRITPGSCFILGNEYLGVLISGEVFISGSTFLLLQRDTLYSTKLI